MSEIFNHLDARLKTLFPNMNKHIRSECVKKLLKRKNDSCITNELIENMVAAYVRHNKTKYDDLMDSGIPKIEARSSVNKLVCQYMQLFKRPKAPWL